MCRARSWSTVPQRSQIGGSTRPIRGRPTMPRYIARATFSTFHTNTPTEPPAATFTATASPTAATVTGTTNFSCSRRRARRRSPYRQAANSRRGGLPTRTRSYPCHRISATCPLAAATRPSRAARASASIRSRRSSSGARFQREHFGQITQRRPFHSSNASRRPTPSPEGPPSPSSLPLQKAQVRYMPAGAGSRERYLAVQRRVPLPAPCSLSLCESIHAERADVDVGDSACEEIRRNLPRQRRQQDTVASVTGRVPQPLDLGVPAEDGPPVGGRGTESGPRALHRLRHEGREQPDGAAEDLGEPLVRDACIVPSPLHRAAEHGVGAAGQDVTLVVIENRGRAAVGPRGGGHLTA